MKRISRLVFRGIFSVALIQPAIGLAFNYPGPDVGRFAISLPPLAEGFSTTLSLKGLVPPGLAAVVVASASPVHPAVWSTVEGLDPAHAWRPAGDRMVITSPVAQMGLLALTNWPGPEGQMPGSRVPEQAGVPGSPNGVGLGAMPAAVTVPEPMGRTLLGLGLAGLMLRAWVSNTRALTQTKPFFRFQGFWWAMTRS